MWSCSILLIKISRINMGDRIAQLVFEKIKTPEIKEATELEGTDRG